jgi:MFS transporter, PHS family, inorganic phosphate transporter
VDNYWRILIGLGCVLDAITLYFRFTIPETPLFTMDIERSVQEAMDDIHNVLSDGNMDVYWDDPDAVVQHTEATHRSRHDFVRYFGRSSNI